MDAPVGEFPADADDENGLVLLYDGVFALLGGEPRIPLQELFRMDEENLVREGGHKLRELHIELVLRHLHRFIDAADGALQEVQVPVLGTDDLLPVPLVHIDGMEVVQVLVGTQGVHVGIDAAARGDAELGQFQPLPLREGMDHFRRPLVQAPDGEADGPLHTVQVIVDTRSGQDRHGSGHAQQCELGGQVVLEHVLDGLDGFFRLLGAAKQVAVVLGKKEGHILFGSFQLCKDTLRGRIIQRIPVWEIPSECVNLQTGNNFKLA